MEKAEDCKGYSSGEASDSDGDFNAPNDDEDISYSSASSLPKLQFRSDISKALWKEDLGLAEVVEKRGKMWVSTGIVRSGKTFCFIEETLYLVEIGALLLLDDNDTSISLQDVYGKVGDEKSGCCWELFEAYRHLKSLGYVIGRHGVPWSVKGVKSSCVSDSVRGSDGKDADLDTLVKETLLVHEMLGNLQVDELRPDFDVYLPNSKFRKSSPGDPIFLLWLVRGSPPSQARIEALERQNGGIPLKFCHVDHGRMSFFSFKKEELPVLP